MFNFDSTAENLPIVTTAALAIFLFFALESNLTIRQRNTALTARNRTLVENNPTSSRRWQELEEQNQALAQANRALVEDNRKREEANQDLVLISQEEHWKLLEQAKEAERLRAMFSQEEKRNKEIFRKLQEENRAVAEANHSLTTKKMGAKEGRNFVILTHGNHQQLSNRLEKGEERIRELERKKLELEGEIDREKGAKKWAVAKCNEILRKNEDQHREKAKQLEAVCKEIVEETVERCQKRAEEELKRFEAQANETIRRNDERSLESLLQMQTWCNGILAQNQDECNARLREYQTRTNDMLGQMNQRNENLNRTNVGLQRLLALSVLNRELGDQLIDEYLRSNSLEVVTDPSSQLTTLRSVNNQEEN